MKRFPPHSTFAALVFFTAAIIMLVVPITATMHIDSAIVAGFTAAITAAWVAATRYVSPKAAIHLRKPREGQSVTSPDQRPRSALSVLLTEFRLAKWPKMPSDLQNLLMLLFLLPVLALPLIASDQMRSCTSAAGLAFWVWIPPVSLVFGYAIGRFVRLSGLPAPRLLATLAIVLLVAGAWLPLLFSPRLFFYHPVIGYWPGALYDEVAVFPDSLPWHRAMTLAWAAVLWGLGDLLKGITFSAQQQTKPQADTALAASKPHAIAHAAKPTYRGALPLGIMAAAMLFLAVCYFYRAESGIHSGRGHLQKSLGGTYEAGPVTLFYSKEHFTPEEIRYIAALHLFHLQEITDTLQVDLALMKRIESYLYADEWQMHALTGAKNVSYVPVWKSTPQLHMRRQAIDATLRHELVHVVAREFGNRPLRASWSIGLVEGLAVALAPPHAGLTIDQQVRANDAFYSVRELSHLFSLTGFYRVSARVAYPVSGSFVAVLLQEFPMSRFKEAYKTSSLQGAYGDDLNEAVRAWHEKVAVTPVSETQRSVARAAFATPGLFDKRCPRMLTGFEKERDLFRSIMAQGDTAQSLIHLNAALALEPDWIIGWQHYIRLSLAREGVAGAHAMEAIKPNMPDDLFLRIMQTDARFMLAQDAKGTVSGGWVHEALAPFSGQDEAFVQRAIMVRADYQRWAHYLSVVHADLEPFERLAEELSPDDRVLLQVYATEYIRRSDGIARIPDTESHAFEVSAVVAPNAIKASSDAVPIHPKEMRLYWQRLVKEPLHPLFCELARPVVLQAAAYIPVSDLENWGRASLCRDNAAGDHNQFVPSREQGLMEAVRFGVFLQKSLE